ncbi:MAG TPA: hypothetical protein VHZ97_00585 [Pseudonocardiaceae bacterium]|jgi:hypothetical protein|nr:hypothetical protein [Pseudonocardiaceae bacterium]
MANDKVYIHEFIHITKQNRARYMHHIAANWSPVGQKLRHQLCYGVWGVVGSTGDWPQVVNLWEEDGFAGLAQSFRTELNNTSLQDPALAKWWAAAADLRSGGLDRLLVPHPDTLTIEALCEAGVSGEVYAHEIVTVRPGENHEFLDRTLAHADKVRDRYGWHLTGAWWTALRNDDECVLLWAIPTWEAWAELEQAQVVEPNALSPNLAQVQDRRRILLVDAPLSPMRIGRQPATTDRTDWED